MTPVLNIAVNLISNIILALGSHPKGNVTFHNLFLWVVSLTRLLAGANHGAPAFRLAEQGYDVWLGNFRGNHESRLTVFITRHLKGVCFPREHKTLDPDTDDKFWQFSQDEMSKYDLPSQLNYVLQSTKKEKVFGQMDMYSIILCRFSMSAIQWAPPPTWR